MKHKPTRGPAPRAAAVISTIEECARPRAEQCGNGKRLQSKCAAGPVDGRTPRPLFSRIDWITFAITSVVVMAGYMYTLAPDLTLEDSGELAVASMYAGVPHPPGYPVWTIYSWMFTKLLPFSNIAWRVGVSSAFAGAVACGLIALMVSRGSSMFMEGMQEFRNIQRRATNALCLVSGFVAGTLLGFNGFMWSQAVIVEVYTLSILSLAGVLVSLFRWIYVPRQHRYLYLAFFLFGICFNNHQSLLVVVLGMEVAIIAVQPRLARDLFFWNVVCWIGGLAARGLGMAGMLNDNPALLLHYNLIGVASMVTWIVLLVRTRKRLIELGRDLAVVGALVYAAMLLLHITNFVTTFYYNGDLHTLNTGRFVVFNLAGIACIGSLAYLIARTGRFGHEWLFSLVCGGAFAGGAAFYLYMPLASMTNPPLNWGYARTVSGFFHAFTRGQYERINPTFGHSLSSDVPNYIGQVQGYVAEVLAEFNLALVLVGLLPFLFLRRMERRERAWLITLGAIYFFLSFFLLDLFNPGADRQSRDLNKVFFMASHVLIAMAIGYGLAIFAAIVVANIERFAVWTRFGALAAALLALAGGVVAWVDTANPLARSAAVFGAILALLGGGLIWLCSFKRRAVPVYPFLGLLALCPIHSILLHWEANEQRGHLFGFWFGHDMFKPPFSGSDGKPLYPEMARNAVLLGGTDPGRFNPTYMIFCDSFMPPRFRRDPEFDRRDVYLITQNALADPPYLNYIRAHYNRSAQVDPPFFSELLRGPREIEVGDFTNVIARALMPLDSFLRDIGDRIEIERRARALYPKREIRTPSHEDSQKAFSDYLADAQRRLREGRLRPGEDVQVIDNRVQVKGQVAVMAINGLLTKTIFDNNPGHEFYLEESYPLEWMFPHLTPYGIIMKINREPVGEFTEDMLARDHAFWRHYSERLAGNWITYETTVTELCQFVEQVHQRRDYSRYKGDRKFIGDSGAQKAFSKLRSSLGGLYAWRISELSRLAQAGQQPMDQLAREQQRVVREAEFAFKQAYAFCPYSPEAIFRYAQLLAGMGRVDEARLLARTSQRLDPNNASLQDLIRQLDAMRPAS